MEIKKVYVLIVIIFFFALYLLIDSCGCIQKYNKIQRFSIGGSYFRLVDDETGRIIDIVELEDMDQATTHFLHKDYGNEDADVSYIEEILGLGAATSSDRKFIPSVRDKTMNSYRECNPNINDDILSLMKCMFENKEINIKLAGGVAAGELSSCLEDEGGLDCHKSWHLLSPVIDKYYKMENVKSPKNWSGLNKLLISGNHFIIRCGVYDIHTYFIEFKEGKFRILSQWINNNTFLDFPFISPVWGKFDSDKSFDDFLELLKIINGNIDINKPLKRYGEKKDNRTKKAIDLMTPDNYKQMIDTINDIFNAQLNYKLRGEDEYPFYNPHGSKQKEYSGASWRYWLGTMSIPKAIVELTKKEE